MSCNRENVTWKTRDGTWSIGFYDFCETNTDDPDRDYEWDVEYDFTRFNFASTGHSTQEHAERAWHGSNPGGTTIVDTPSERTDQLDKMAAECLAAHEAANREYRRKYGTGALTYGGRW